MQRKKKKRKNGHYRVKSGFDWDQMVLFSRVEAHPIVDPMILALAMSLVDRRTRLRGALDRLERSFPGLKFFAFEPCDCKLPNCLGLSYGVVGYLEGWLDFWGIAHGTQVPILRFDPVETEVSHEGEG